MRDGSVEFAEALDEKAEAEGEQEGSDQGGKGCYRVEDQAIDDLLKECGNACWFGSYVS